MGVIRPLHQFLDTVPKLGTESLYKNMTILGLFFVNVKVENPRKNRQKTPKFERLGTRLRKKD